MVFQGDKCLLPCCCFDPITNVKFGSYIIELLVYTINGLLVCFAVALGELITKCRHKNKLYAANQKWDRFTHPP